MQRSGQATETRASEHRLRSAIPGRRGQSSIWCAMGAGLAVRRWESLRRAVTRRRGVRWRTCWRSRESSTSRAALQKFSKRLSPPSDKFTGAWTTSEPWKLVAPERRDFLLALSKSPDQIRLTAPLDPHLSILADVQACLGYREPPRPGSRRCLSHDARGHLGQHQSRLFGAAAGVTMDARRRL